MITLQLFLKFLIGGAVIAGVTVLTQHIHPKAGGLLAVAPIITTLSIIFVWIDTDPATTRAMIYSAAWFLIPTLVFLVAMYFLLGKIHVFPALLLAYAVWAISSAAFFLR